MSTKAKILAKGSALRSITLVANCIVALFMMPFIIHSLGDKMYGLWILIGTFIGYYWLFDLGLGSAIQRYVSKAIGKQDYDEANIVINTSIFLFSIIGLCVIIISFIIAFFIPQVIKNIKIDTALLRHLIIILGLSFAIGFPMRVFSGILISHLRYDLTTSVELLKLLIRTILVIIFLKMGYGIMSLALITFGVNLTGYIITFFISRRIAKYIILSRKLIDRLKIKSLFKYSTFSFITNIADKLRFNVDNFVIAAFLGLNFVTVYSIAARLIKYFGDFIISALGMLTPVFSQYEGRGDYKSIREKFILMTRISSYLSILIGGTLIIFGNAFIRRWVGEKYLGAYPLLIILAIPTILALMQSPSVQLLYGISKHKFYAITNSIEGVSNLILSLILVRRFGLMGVALGTAIPMIIIKLFIQPVYTCKVIKLGVYKYYLEMMLVSLRSSAIFVFIWHISKSLIMPNYVNLLLLASIQSMFFVAIVFFIGFNKTERSYFKKIIFMNKSLANVN